jgi:hypothetical protein
MRLLIDALRAIVSTRAPAKPFAANSLNAATRILSRLRAGFRVPDDEVNRVDVAFATKPAKE